MKNLFVQNRTFVLGILLVAFALYLIPLVDLGHAAMLTMAMTLINGYIVIILGWLIRTEQAKIREDPIIAMLLGELVWWYNYLHSVSDLRETGLFLGIAIFAMGFFWIIIDYAVENPDPKKIKAIQV